MSATPHTTLVLWSRLAAFAGFLGVALGAFGAHGLKPLLNLHGAQGWWETATLYLLVHAVAALAALAWARSVRPAALFLLGCMIFSGSLYVMSVTGLRWLGAITPIGGVLLLAGWLSLVFVNPEPQA